MAGSNVCESYGDFGFTISRTSYAAPDIQKSLKSMTSYVPGLAQVPNSVV